MVSNNLPLEGATNLYDYFPIEWKHFQSTLDYFFSKTNYFSLENLWQGVYANPSIPGSYANSFTLDKTFVNLPFFCENKISFKGENKQVFEVDEEFIPYGDWKGISAHFSNFSAFLLREKISNSSFFIHEIINILQIKSEFPLDDELFFENFTRWEEFCKIYGIQTKELEIKMSEIPTRFLVTHENVFCKKALALTAKNLNTDEYFINTMNPTIKAPFDREVLVPKKGPYETGYDFYMGEVLGVKRSFMGSVFYRELLDYLKFHKPFHSFFENKYKVSINFIKGFKDKLEFIGNQIFLQSTPLFFYFSKAELGSIKRFSRFKEIRKIIAVDLTNFKKEEILLRERKESFLRVFY